MIGQDVRVDRDLGPRGRSSAAGARRARGSPTSRRRARPTLLDERLADIAAHGVRHLRRGEDRAEQRGRRRLALRAGNRQDPCTGSAEGRARPRSAARHRVPPPRAGPRAATGRWSGSAARSTAMVTSRSAAATSARASASETPRASANRPARERGQRVGQLARGSPVVGGHRRAGIGQVAGRGDAGAGQAEHHSAPPDGGRPGTGCGGWRSSSVHLQPVHAGQEDARSRAGRRAPTTIQKRMVIFSSAQPMSSKWCWSGAMRKIRRPRSLNEPTWRTTDRVTARKTTPMTASSSSWRGDGRHHGQGGAQARARPRRP